MNRNLLAGTALLGLVAVQSVQAELPAPAQLTEAQLIDHAIAQAKLAMDATIMSRAKPLLQRAANCLIGRDSGYFVVGAGGPCNSRINLTTSITNKQKRDLVTDAYNKLLGGSGKADLQEAQDWAEDAVGMLEEAQQVEE